MQTANLKDASPAQETIIRSFMRDLNRECDRIGNLADRLNASANRVHGAPPPIPTAQAGLSSVAMSIVEELGGFTSRLDRLLTECETQMSRVEGFV